MTQNCCRKKVLCRNVKKQAGIQSPCCRCEKQPPAALFTGKKPACNPQKKIIHQEICHKDYVYVYFVRHKNPPMTCQSSTLVSAFIIGHKGVRILSKSQSFSQEFLAEVRRKLMILCHLILYFFHGALPSSCEALLPETVREQRLFPQLQK